MQLSWDTDTNDLDLHTTKQGSDGRYCIDAANTTDPVDGLLSEDCDSGLDCNFAGCKAGSYGDPPEWDGVAGRTAGDPMLDIDDLHGFGPENINVDAMPEGNYLVGVNTYSAGTTVLPQMSTRAGGETFTLN